MGTPMGKSKTKTRDQVRVRSLPPPGRKVWVQPGAWIERLPATYKTLKPGLHGDGGNLYLQISEGSNGQRRRSWIFRYALAGRKRRDMGLGSLDDITLAEARETARQYRKMLKEGIDPIVERDRQRAKNIADNVGVISFDEAAARYIAQHRAGWKNLDHSAQWESSLKRYASPVLGKMNVANITTAHVMKAIEPHWNEKTETASRVRGRIEAVLGWCTVSGFRTGENPARWKDHLDNLLAPRRKIHAVKNQPALPYAELPGFFADLRKRPGMPALALQFAILTCVRASDVVNAKHADIDRAARMWTIPSFSKTAAVHRVPLSAAALAVFDKARENARAIGGDAAKSALAFPNDVTGKRVATNSLLGVIEALGRKGIASTHGMRASFRTWAQEQTNFPWELAEMALGHQVGTKVERAYARGDALKKRFAIMDSWASFCTKPRDEHGRVIALRRAGQADEPARR
jgi:integrase